MLELKFQSEGKYVVLRGLSHGGPRVESSTRKGKDMAAAFNASLELSRVPVNNSIRFGNAKNNNSPLGDCIVGGTMDETFKTTNKDDCSDVDKGGLSLISQDQLMDRDIGDDMFGDVLVNNLFVETTSQEEHKEQKHPPSNSWNLGETGPQFDKESDWDEFTFDYGIVSTSTPHLCMVDDIDDDVGLDLVFEDKSDFTLHIVEHEQEPSNFADLDSKSALESGQQLLFDNPLFEIGVDRVYDNPLFELDDETTPSCSIALDKNSKIWDPGATSSHEVLPQERTCGTTSSLGAWTHFPISLHTISIWEQ